MKTYLIESSQELTDWFTDVHKMGEGFYPITLQVSKGNKKHRSLEQNALIHMWYREIADQTGDSTMLDIKRYCKLNIGIPLLLEDAEFSEKYYRVMKDVDYEDELEAMDLIDVTSLMTTKQMSQYIDNMEYEFIPKGFQLTNPEDRRRHG